MQAISNTGKNNIFVLKIDENDINTVLLNTDYDESGVLQYAYANFADAFSDSVLEYAFAFSLVDVPKQELAKKLREAAKSLIKLHEIETLKNYMDNHIPETEWDKDFRSWYEKKGVFGEVILHLILKEFKNTIPLISKLYFKDSFAQEAKGFDAVHVSSDGSTLWLGETKFYKAWKKKGLVNGGIDELVEDLKHHFTRDYLSEQFVIIKRGLDSQFEHPQRALWIDKLSKPVVLKDIFQYVKIPLLCIYEDQIAKDYLSKIDDAIKDAGIVSHTGTVQEYFNLINDCKMKDRIQTILILMPVEAKNKIVSCMLERIWHMQNI